MLVLVRHEKPIGHRTFMGSNGWLWRFQRKYRISNHRRTNKKTAPLKERLPRIQNFHRWLIKDLQHSAPQRCEKYGRFPPALVFHMDQHPLPFVLDCNATLDCIGSQSVHIKQPKGSGLDKRQATLQLCIRAEGEQLVNPAIIFRGRGLQIGLEELRAYSRLSGLVDVYFQPKAWADGLVMDHWLERFNAQTEQLGERLLGMDNHGAQQTARFRSRMAEVDVVPAYTPPDTTDLTAPLDHHVGANMKHIISKLFWQAMEENHSEWNQNGLPAWRLRVLMAEWTALAWHKVLKLKSEFLFKSFVSTGFCVAKDGSENHLIKIPNESGVLGQYTF
jgi:hypothetical protein